MQIIDNLEKLAQSHGCILEQADHKSTDKAAIEDDPGVDTDTGIKVSRRDIYGCDDDGCEEGKPSNCGGDRNWSSPKVWTKKNPTFIWDYCSCLGQMDPIMRYTRVGCSTEVKSDGKTCISFAVLSV